MSEYVGPAAQGIAVAATGEPGYAALRGWLPGWHPPLTAALLQACLLVLPSLSAQLRCQQLPTPAPPFTMPSSRTCTNGELQLPTKAACSAASCTTNSPVVRLQGSQTAGRAGVPGVACCHDCCSQGRQQGREAGLAGGWAAAGCCVALDGVRHAAPEQDHPAAGGWGCCTSDSLPCQHAPGLCVALCSAAKGSHPDSSRLCY